MKEHFYVYITASKTNRVLYIGVTSNLQQRIYQHKNGTYKGFSKKYNVNRLVYYEVYNDAENAIAREKAMKEWQRAWKIKRIEEQNPNWKDLYEEICC